MQQQPPYKPDPFAFFGLARGATLEHVVEKYDELCSETGDRARIKLITEALDYAHKKILDAADGIESSDEEEIEPPYIQPPYIPAPLAFFGLNPFATLDQVAEKWKELCSETTDRDRIKLLTEAKDYAFKIYTEFAEKEEVRKKEEEAKKKQGPKVSKKRNPAKALEPSRLQKVQKKPDHFALLNLYPSATLDQVVKKFKELVSETTDGDRIKLLTEARDYAFKVCKKNAEKEAAEAQYEENKKRNAAFGEELLADINDDLDIKYESSVDGLKKLLRKSQDKNAALKEKNEILEYQNITLEEQTTALGFENKALQAKLDTELVKTLQGAGTIHQSPLLTNVAKFVAEHLAPKAGNFLNTKLVQDAFIDEYNMDSSTFSEKGFQRMLKASVDAAFPDVYQSRERQDGGRPRGYIGLTLCE